MLFLLVMWFIIIINKNVSLYTVYSILKYKKFYSCL